MSFAMHFLYARVVGVFVRDEKCGLDIAAVRVFAFSVENFFVQINVIVVDGVVKGDCDHLGYIFGWEIARNGSTVFGTEAIGQVTNGWVAMWSTVGVTVDI